MENSHRNDDRSDCCSRPITIDTGSTIDASLPYIEGVVKIAGRDIPRVSTRLTRRDRIGSYKVRWGIGRARYQIDPGLYAVGSPSTKSPVFVTANYKMSFDRLRSNLDGIDGWILVLDTKAVNVWCSAGKGTFGTDELVNRIGIVRLPEIVSHKRLILPQLSATGVSAHDVKNRSGFRVRFGPVRAEDIPEYMRSKIQATPDMRRVRFPFKDRIVLAPVEIVGMAKYALPVALALLLLAGLNLNGYAFDRILTYGAVSALLIVVAWILGAVLTPALLPWLPGRAFSVKGAWAGIIILIVSAVVLSRFDHNFPSMLSGLSWLFIIPAITSHLGMLFTGSSTYTSLSGVKKEMRIAVPAQITAAAVGTILWFAGLFI